VLPPLRSPEPLLQIIVESSCLHDHQTSIFGLYVFRAGRRLCSRNSLMWLLLETRQRRPTGDLLPEQQVSESRSVTSILLVLDATIVRQLVAFNICARLSRYRSPKSGSNAEIKNHNTLTRLRLWHARPGILLDLTRILLVWVSHQGSPVTYFSFNLTYTLSARLS
jgi:hypothetical protein